MATAASLTGQHRGSGIQQQTRHNNDNQQVTSPSSKSPPRREDATENTATTETTTAVVLTAKTKEHQETLKNNSNRDDDSGKKPTTTKKKSLQEALLSVVPGKSRKSGKIASHAHNVHRTSPARTAPGVEMYTVREAMNRDGSAPTRPLPLAELFEPPATTSSATPVETSTREGDDSAAARDASGVTDNSSVSDGSALKGDDSTVGGGSGQSGDCSAYEGSMPVVLNGGRPTYPPKAGCVQDVLKRDSPEKNVPGAIKGGTFPGNDTTALRGVAKGSKSPAQIGSSSTEPAPISGTLQTQHGSRGREQEELQGSSNSAAKDSSARVVAPSTKDGSKSRVVAPSTKDGSKSRVVVPSTKDESKSTPANTPGSPLATESRDSCRKRKGQTSSVEDASVSDPNRLTGITEAAHMIQSRSSASDTRPSDVASKHIPRLPTGSKTSAVSCSPSAMTGTSKIQADGTVSEGSDLVQSAQSDKTARAASASALSEGLSNDRNVAVTTATGLDAESMTTLLEFESVIDSISQQAGLGQRESDAAADDVVFSLGLNQRPQGEPGRRRATTATSLFGDASSPPVPVPPRRHKSKRSNAGGFPGRGGGYQVGLAHAVQDPPGQEVGTNGLSASQSSSASPSIGGRSESTPRRPPDQGPSTEATGKTTTAGVQETCRSSNTPSVSSHSERTSPPQHSPRVSGAAVKGDTNLGLDKAESKQPTLRPEEHTKAAPGEDKSAHTQPKTKPSPAEETNLATETSNKNQPGTLPNSSRTTPSASTAPPPTTSTKPTPSPSQTISTPPTTTPPPPPTTAATTPPPGPAQHAVTAQENQPDASDEELACYNHPGTPPERYCSDHQHPVCLECAFELHRSCRDVEGLQAAAVGRREELDILYEGVLRLKAGMEAVLTDADLLNAKLEEERTVTLAELEKFTEAAIKAIRIKGTQLKAEAESLYTNEEAGTQARAERVRAALTSLREVQSQAEQVLASGGQGRLLRQFGKLKGRCQALLETDLLDPGKALSCVRVSSAWFDDVTQLPPAKLTVERKPLQTKTKTQLSQRGLDTFRRICKKRRQNLLPDASGHREGKVTPVMRSGPRASRVSLARSVTSSVSLPSVLSSSHQTTGGIALDTPQSVFEFFAGLESDKYPFGLGDICVMQPRLTILITYLTSDLLRVFPWRRESSAFVSPPLGCALCCMCQLSHETVAVTSSNSDQLSFFKVGQDSVQVTHTVSMGRQYRAVTSLDYRTLALATDSKRTSANVIAIVRFDSADYRSYTALHTIHARKGAIPALGFFSKTVFKVPYSLCTSNSGHIIVSDSENKALLGLHHDGQRAFFFQPPKQSRVIDTPGGVACSPAGYLYLVDSCEQRVLRFDRSGVFRKVALSQEDGLEWPIGVACVDDSTLCVAEFYGQVKVFRIR